jgi:hypothetical protein
MTEERTTGGVIGTLQAVFGGVAEDVFAPPPVTDGSAVLAHDGYDVGEWHAALRTFGKLAGAVERGRAQVVTAPALIRDLFWSHGLCNELRRLHDSTDSSGQCRGYPGDMEAIARSRSGTGIPQESFRPAEPPMRSLIRRDNPGGGFVRWGRSLARNDRDCDLLPSQMGDEIAPNRSSPQVAPPDCGVPKDRGIGRTVGQGTHVQGSRDDAIGPLDRAW